MIGKPACLFHKRERQTGENGLACPKEVTMKEIKLGVIGLSEGNRHPFSWSAIINGDFNEKAMAECGFPVIGEYLSVNRPRWESRAHR